MSYCNMFHARFSDRQDRYRPAEMMSYSYGQEHGDPAPTDVIIEGVSKHRQVSLWLAERGLFARVFLLGDETNGPCHNLPTTLLICLRSKEERDEFITEVIDGY